MDTGGRLVDFKFEDLSRGWKRAESLRSGGMHPRRTGSNPWLTDSWSDDGEGDRLFRCPKLDSLMMIVTIRMDPEE